ncbi:DUF6318 family protein [Nocardioides kongjuensis]|uniref:DUF6318 domain-containing protein n=1 Tax=Nocardioides kongjuensis TaxID=349522 RepID=A0A852RMR7_9ACTN|nr:DUF6318 family protein [Nocardioides kongjuensis]NYD30160.1 hypothetical protein [Nocardioides kongjuensis]
MATTIRAAVAMLVLLLLSGCSDGNASPRDPSSTWSPTGTMQTPTSAAPDPVEPQLPAAAKEASEAGARAFIAYYWDLINYAQVTGDVKALRSVSGPHCNGCKAGIRGVRELYAEGGHIEGGGYSVHLVKVNQLKSTNPSHFAFEAKLSATTDEQTVIAGDGTSTTNPVATSTVVVAVLWLDSQWRLEAMQVS